MATSLDANSIYAHVQHHYGRTARSNKSGTQSAHDDDNNTYGQTVASAFGYTSADLLSAPTDSNLGLSCGNPGAIARLQAGETVIDLGCGAGFDVFQAARKITPGGKVIGVDMNKDMLARAESIKANTGADNASFLESRITSIPALADGTADCIISNCVINLVPAAEKQDAFREMYRLLKPKGRIAISDILLKKPLSDEMRGSVALYVGCVAGASKVEEYEAYMKKAGFRDILIVNDKSDLNIYKTANESGKESGCCGSSGDKTVSPSSGKKKSCGVANEDEKENEAGDIDLNEWAGSFKISAMKPEM